MYREDCLFVCFVCLFVLVSVQRVKENYGLHSHVLTHSRFN